MALPEPHPDRRPGSDQALTEFYDLVPVAEELDLIEEAELARECVWWGRALSDPDANDVLIEEPDQETEDDGAANLTEGQVIGLLEHVLGAERLDSEPRGRG